MWEAMILGLGSNICLPSLIELFGHLWLVPKIWPKRGYDLHLVEQIKFFLGWEERKHHHFRRSPRRWGSEGLAEWQGQIRLDWYEQRYMGVGW